MPAGEIPLTEAAVLVPVFRREGELRVLLVRRVDRGVHGGQLAFPGGRCEPGDASPLAAALREAREEVGVVEAEPAVLAALPPIETLATGFRIWPFLARLTPPPAWRPEEAEIVEVIEAPLAALALPAARAVEVMRRADGLPPEPFPCLRVGPHRLWGASLRILEPLLPRLLAGEWPI